MTNITAGNPPVKLSDVLLECLRHFVHLDESNAAIHFAAVRYSPITFRLAEQLTAMSDDTPADQFVRDVMSHVGQYAEDSGR